MLTRGGGHKAANLAGPAGWPLQNCEERLLSNRVAHLGGPCSDSLVTVARAWQVLIVGFKRNVELAEKLLVQIHFQNQLYIQRPIPWGL